MKCILLINAENCNEKELRFEGLGIGVSAKQSTAGAPCGAEEDDREGNTQSPAAIF